MRRYLLPFLLVFGVFSSFTFAGSFTTMTAWAAGKRSYESWGTLARAFHEIEARYVEEVDEQELVYAALEGLVGSLDPHSLFLDPEAYAKLQDADAERYYGIGARMVPAEGLKIVEVIPGSPAEREGLHLEDVIHTIDGEDITSLPFEEAAARISGERGVAVSLGITRAGEELTLSIVRDLVHIPTVSYELVEPGLGYLSILHFSEGTSGEVKAALKELEHENEAPVELVIIDLRDNPGGLLREAVAVADLFVGDVPLVTTRNRAGEIDDEYRGTESRDDSDAELRILVNGGSASASEIVAGTLQAMERATLVGTSTYGKGSVQSIWEFEDGSALKLTIARYYLSDGTPIDHRHGLEPDLIVHTAEQDALEELIASFKVQAGEASLREIDRSLLERALSDVELTPPDANKRSLWNTPVADRAETDRQLAEALKRG